MRWDRPSRTSGDNPMRSAGCPKRWATARVASRSTGVRTTSGGLGFDLVNNADLLIRLGRHAEASRLLDEVDRGAIAGIGAYKQRVRRAALMRVLNAAIQHRPDEVARLAATGTAVREWKNRTPPPELAASVRRYGSPGRASPMWLEAHRPARCLCQSAESWILGSDGAMTKGTRRRLTNVAETLVDKSAATSEEFRWSIAAIGAAAARAVRSERESTFRTEAQGGLERLRKEWKGDVSYEGRPDLIELRRKAGLN